MTYISGRMKLFDPDARAWASGVLRRWASAVEAGAPIGFPRELGPDDPEWGSLPWQVLASAAPDRFWVNPLPWHPDDVCHAVLARWSESLTVADYVAVCRREAVGLEVPVGDSSDWRIPSPPPPPREYRS